MQPSTDGHLTTESMMAARVQYVYLFYGEARIACPADSEWLSILRHIGAAEVEEEQYRLADKTWEQSA